MTGYFLIISSPEFSPDPPALHKCGGPARREVPSSAAMAPALLLLLLALLPRGFPLLGKCPQGLCGMRRAEETTGPRWGPNPAWLTAWVGGSGGEHPHFNPLGAAWGAPRCGGAGGWESHLCPPPCPHPEVPTGQSHPTRWPFGCPRCCVTGGASVSPTAVGAQPLIDLTPLSGFPSDTCSPLRSVEGPGVGALPSGLWWVWRSAVGRWLLWGDVKVAEALAQIRVVKPGESCSSCWNLELAPTHSENYHDFQCTAIFQWKFCTCPSPNPLSILCSPVTGILKKNFLALCN